jgi:hypothetical protein
MAKEYVSRKLKFETGKMYTKELLCGQIWPKNDFFEVLLIVSSIVYECQKILIEYFHRKFFYILQEIFVNFDI